MVEEEMVVKICSFQTWDKFTAWATAITGPKFRAFILECIDKVTAKGDSIKDDLQEIRSNFEED